jgi:NADH-quinone oxidoreductase subunit J
MAGLPLPLLLAQTSAPASNAAATVVPIAPVLILILCVVAGVATVLLLPSRREAPLRKIGGVLLLAAGLITAAVLIRSAAYSIAGGLGAYFWIFSAIALFGAIRVITHSRPVYSALYFVLTVFASAGLFLLMWAEFMAAALVLIYAGAILVTYVFVIMLAAEAAPKREATAPAPGGASEGIADYDAVSRDPLISAAVGFTLMGVLLFVIFDRAQGSIPAPSPEPRSTLVSGATQELGEYLFNHHLVNLELAGLILTVSMVGAIVIARKRVVGEAAENIRAAAGAPMPTLATPATPLDDNPHSIPVQGTSNPRQKAYPEA